MPPQKCIPSGDAGFDVFWLHYPRKEEKSRAYALWQRYTLMLGVSPRTIIDGLLSYPFSGDDAQYWPLPTTWLNGERWNHQRTRPPTQIVKQTRASWRDRYDGGVS